MTRLVSWVMDYYRGRPGFLGRLVFRADVRWLRQHVDAVTRRRT